MLSYTLTDFVTSGPYTGFTHAHHRSHALPRLLRCLVTCRCRRYCTAHYYTYLALRVTTYTSWTGIRSSVFFVLFGPGWFLRLHLFAFVLFYHVTVTRFYVYLDHYRTHTTVTCHTTASHCHRYTLSRSARYVCRSTLHVAVPRCYVLVTIHCRYTHSRLNFVRFVLRLHVAYTLFAVRCSLDDGCPLPRC